MKRVSEIFGDFSAESNIINAFVENVTLRKKTKTLVLDIRSDNYLDIKEIEDFNDFLKKRFGLNDSKIVIKYTKEVEKKPIEEEIKNIMLLLSVKHPFLRGAIKNTEYEVSNNTINIYFKVEISHIFRDLNYHKEIQAFVKNLYGKTYNVNFIDKVDHEALMKLKEDELKREITTINNVIESSISNSKRKSNKKDSGNGRNYEGKKEYNRPKEYTKSIKKEDNAALILGRSATFRDKIIKICDITPYEGTVAIEGEIANIESKELRSGKMLVSFDLYDGSSSISCKCFVKGEQYDEVISKIKKAKGLKLWGNSGVSKFTGEIEVIANTIVETKGMTKVVRKDNSEIKRVELHMHTKMSQMDAVSSAADLIKRAMSWGMKSIAITDHGVVQAFPEAHKLLGRNNSVIKIIYVV